MLSKKRFNEFISSYNRVLKLAKKPDRKEFSLVSRITGIGIILIGLFGFLIKLVSTLIRMYYGG
ncbi:MAG: protein translocase SEC61 complex subunit gamma [Candidatus Methanofastidiosia archaeon]